MTQEKEVETMRQESVKQKKIVFIVEMIVHLENPKKSF